MWRFLRQSSLVEDGTLGDVQLGMQAGRLIRSDIPGYVVAIPFWEGINSVDESGSELYLSTRILDWLKVGPTTCILSRGRAFPLIQANNTTQLAHEFRWKGADTAAFQKAESADPSPDAVHAKMLIPPQPGAVGPICALELEKILFPMDHCSAQLTSTPLDYPMGVSNQTLAILGIYMVLGLRSDTLVIFLRPQTLLFPAKSI